MVKNEENCHFWHQTHLGISPIYSRRSKTINVLCLNHVHYSLLNLRAITTQKCNTHRLDHSSRRLLLEGPLLDLESCLVDLLK